MKLFLIESLMVLAIVGIAGMQKQEEPTPVSEIALANVDAFCDVVGEVYIEYDKGCLAEDGEGCVLSPYDYRYDKKPYND